MTTVTTSADPGPSRSVLDTMAKRETAWVWVASEVLLVVTSIVTVRMLGRLFIDSAYFAPIVFTVIVSHGVLIATRRLGFGSAVSAIVSAISVTFAIVATHYSATATAVLIPNSDTLAQFQVDLADASEVFNSMQTPVPAVAGFLVGGSLLAWALTFAADWAAFRAFAPGQALMPSLIVLVFVSLVGLQDDRVLTTGLLVATGAFFLLSHRAANRASHGIWLGNGPSRGYVALMLGGAVVAAAAAAAGILAGPQVPGADESPLIEIGEEGRQENKPIEVISPLVEIQPRLVDQSDLVLFSVETTERAYWRIAALDKFDGQLWRSQGKFTNTNDGLDIAYPTNLASDTIISTFDVDDLRVVWAPAPYLPVAFDNLNDDVDLNYEAESATFIVDTRDQATSDGLRYVVQAESPRLTPDALRQATLASTDSPAAHYLELPADFSPFAQTEAQRITAGQPTAYDKARALQDFFRDNFIYDLDVAAGHNIERVDDFLNVRRGYCEQFAGTYAAMARSIGLPSRVATGFTPGEQDPSNPNRYVVRGRHAHAWPEVWISGAGWVAFEPTPGRGAPNSTSYTGAPESQDSTTAEQAEAAPEQEAAPQPEASPQPTPTLVPPEPDAEQQAPIPESVEEPVQEEPVPEPDRGGLRAAMIALGLVVLLVALLLGIPALKRSKDARRRARFGEDPRRQVTLAWSVVTDRLERMGYPPDPTETLSEYCLRLQNQLVGIKPRFAELTELTVAASYDERPPSPADTRRARELASEIHASLDSDLSLLARGADEVDPRPLLRFADPIAERANRLAAGATSLDCAHP